MRVDNYCKRIAQKPGGRIGNLVDRNLETENSFVINGKPAITTTRHKRTHYGNVGEIGCFQLTDTSTLMPAYFCKQFRLWIREPLRKCGKKLRPIRVGKLTAKPITEDTV